LPALFIHGQESPLPVSSSQRTVELIPGAKLVVIEGIGHFPWIELPDSVRAAVDLFLSL
jgi:proline iminopeptidase